MRTKSISPLRYPGSKRHLMDYVAQSLKANHFYPKIYVEPFVGGGNVAFYLLQQQIVEKVILIDLDPWIASFWQAVFWDTEWLLRQIEQAKVTLESWQEMKKSDPVTPREQAWACLFLNRTSFSGILRPEVGPLGGKSQTSPYKIDCRFPRQTLVERIRTIASFRERVYAVWNLSWEEGLQNLRAEQRAGSLPSDRIFFYLDPPFFEKADALYRYYFQEKDHRALRDTLLKLNDKWLLSYDSAEQVETLYGEAIASSANGAKRSDVELLYSLSLRERKRGKEVILSNLEILPEFNGRK
ncbi:MAG: DNA adenine methylase [Anaerolineales bacterium]|nr:DNA adenine methylase [Anaerolineales bacterium]MDW8277988.1 DNA adenine methylase [Anaerolineales bacterium]